MGMTLNHTKASCEELVREHSGERLKKVAVKWEKLREDFQEYTDKASASPCRHLKICKQIIKSHLQMRQLQDRNPEVFAEWMVNSKQPKAVGDVDGDTESSSEE